MAEDITAPLESLGHVTQQIVPPAITGAEITRLESIKTLVPRAIENLASGIGDLGSSLARLTSGMQEPSQPFVTRDQQGNIQVQPQPGILFGPNADALSHAALHGTVAGAGWRIGEDLNRIQAQHLGDPQGFLTAANGYLASQQQGFAAGGTKIANAINEEAQQRIGEIHGGMLLRQGALDIQNSRTAVDTRINSLSNDMYQLAAQGGMQSPQFAQKQSELQGQYGALASNPVYGVPKEQADALFAEKMATFRGASIVGQMDAAYHENGATGAQKQLVDSVGALPNLSEPERAQLIARGNARLSYLQGQNADAIQANQQKLDAFDKLINAGKLQATTDLLQPIIAEAHRTGDTDTVSRAMAIMQTHPIKQATEGLLPSQIDQVHLPNGAPSDLPAGLRNNNPLNIKYIGQPGTTPSTNLDQGQPQAVYPTMQHGWQAGLDLLQRKYGEGMTTPAQIIAGEKGWTPGNTAAAANVARSMGVGVNEDLRLNDPARLNAFANALATQEQGPAGQRFLGSVLRGQTPSSTPDARAFVAQHGGDINRAVDDAMTKMGEHEVVNRADLREYLRTGGHDMDPKTAAWCAAFVGAALEHAGIASASDRATSYMNWGVPASGAIRKGDVLVWGRGETVPVAGGLGHVAFATGKTDAQGRIEVVGGNVGNRVVTEFVSPANAVIRRYDPNAPTRENAPLGRQPSAVISANGVPFTAKQLNDNPYLASELVKATASDQKNRNQMADAVMTGIERGLSNHMMPSADNLTMAGQLVQGNPKLEERYSNIEDRVRGEGVGQQAAGYAGGQALIDQARANANGADFHHQAIAAQAFSARNYAAREIDQNPAAAAARIGITHGVLPPIDTGDPGAISAGIAVRGGIARAMMDRGLHPRSAVFPPDRPAVEGLLSSGSPAAKAALLDSVAGLPDPIREATMADPAAKAAVLSMAHSGQPQLMSRAYSFLDQEYRRNPMTFDSTFGAGTLKDLRNWQDDLSWRTPEQIAERELKADDPATIRAQENMRSLADESLKNVTGKDIANKFVSWAQRWNPVGGDYLPLGESMGGMTLQAMRDDYQRAYRESFALNANPTAADKYAMEKISGVRDGQDTGGGKWSASPANSGRIMAWAPERSPAYPQVNGSKDYIGTQAQEFVTRWAQERGIEAPITGATMQSPPTTPLRFGTRPYALVPDHQTEVEMTAGRPPSYSVAVQDPNGRLFMLPSRFVADPAAARLAAQSIPRDLSAMPATAWKTGQF